MKFHSMNAGSSQDSLQASQFDWIDGLVSGELHGSDYRRAILALENDPKLWRICALAFLEDQAIRTEMRQLAGESLHWDSKVKLASTPSIEFEPPSRSVRRFHWLSLSGLAALLLMGFGMGWWIRPHYFDNAQYVVSGDDQKILNQDVMDAHSAGGPIGNDFNQKSIVEESLRQQAPANSRIAKSDGVGDRDDYQDPDFPGINRNNRTTRGNISTALADRFLAIDQELPEWLRKLERQGQVRIERSNAIMPLTQSDGSSILLPIEQLQIVPVVYSY